MANAGYDEHDTQIPYEHYWSSETIDPNIDGKQWFKQSIICSAHTTEIVEAPFRDQQDNPERYKDHGILAAQCLVDEGIIDKVKQRQNTMSQPKFCRLIMLMISALFKKFPFYL